MVSKSTKIDISIQVILILLSLWIATYGILLFNLKTKTDYYNNILFRKSIEKICGEDRIINSKIPNTYKGHALGTYHSDYSMFDITKPLTETETEKVQVSVNEEYREVFNENDSFLSRLYSIDTIKINSDDKRLMWLSVEFNIKLFPMSVMKSNSQPIVAVGIYN
jgi:hypothetical protein